MANKKLDSDWPEPKYKKGDILIVRWTKTMVDLYLINGVRSSKYSTRKHYLCKKLNGKDGLTKPYFDMFDFNDSCRLATEAEKILYGCKI